MINKGFGDTQTTESVPESFTECLKKCIFIHLLLMAYYTKHSRYTNQKKTSCHQGIYSMVWKTEN